MVGQKTPEMRSTHNDRAGRGASRSSAAIRARSTAGARARVRRHAAQEAVELRASKSRCEARDKGRNAVHDSERDHAGAGRAVHRAARDRRAEDADLHQRRVHPRRRQRRGSASWARWRPRRAPACYALQLDSQLFDITTARAPVNAFADRQAQGEGLETLAGATRGALFNVTGTGENVFDRITSELSGYYLLGVESDGRDKDGKPHPIRVEVARRGAIVRSRRQLINAASDRPAARSPRAAAAAALSSPLLVVGAAGPRRVVRAAGAGARQGAAADSRRRRHRLPGVEGGLDRLRHHRSRRQGRRQQVGRHAAAAGDERRAVAAAVHHRRQPRRRATTP